MRNALALLLLAFAAVALVAGAETYFWVDSDGVTHMTDDPANVPEHARTQSAALDPASAGLSDLWRGSVQDNGRERREIPLDGSGEDDRTHRLIRGAVDDLRRGETSRATVALESVLRQQPGNPRAHWYLALLARQRGRYVSAEVHLQAFLDAAGEELEPWRASAQRRLAALEDERRLADPEALDGAAQWVALAAEHFRVNYDSDLESASPDYAQTALRYLEQARAAVQERLGAVPEEPMGVVFYGKAAYLQAHQHRFSFQTVGFFDGRIHVVSAGHPAGELRALLFHEYTHAVFREHTGGDRPYWLNEGLAELSEFASRGRNRLTRSERAALRMRIDEGSWLPLRRIAPSFSGLDDQDARGAYLEAAAAASWIETRTTREQRAHLLTRLGEGATDDEALHEVLGLDTDGVDEALRESILADFPNSRPRTNAVADQDQASE